MAMFDASLLLDKLKGMNTGNEDLATSIRGYETIMLRTGFKAVKTSLKYTEQAVFANRISRMISRTWFRICKAIPFSKRMTLQITGRTEAPDTIYI